MPVGLGIIYGLRELFHPSFSLIRPLEWDHGLPKAMWLHEVGLLAYAIK